MAARRVTRIYAILFLVIGLPFTVMHILARPDDAPITPIQHAVAALGNFFGPWGVAMVRLVDFPNAGMRSFSMNLACGLTLLGLTLWALPTHVKKKPLQYVCIALFPVFALFWFGFGFLQIASGLL